MKTTRESGSYAPQGYLWCPGAVYHFLVEHTAGHSLAGPVQVQVIPVGDDYLAYAREVADTLFAAGVQ